MLDSKGSRNTANLVGGMNDASFINDAGYGLNYYPSGVGSPFVIGRRAVLSNANVFNNFADFSTINGTGADSRQALVNNELNTLTPHDRAALDHRHPDYGHDRRPHLHRH